MRLLLLGGLSFLLVALLGVGTWLVAKGGRRAVRQAPPADEAPEAATSLPPPERHRRPRPATSRTEAPRAGACAARPALPGRARLCGHLIISHAVAVAWRKERAAPGVRDEASGEARAAADAAAAAGDVAAPASGQSGDREGPLLPPEGSYASFFEMTAVARSGERAKGERDLEEGEERDATTPVPVAVDGAFEIDVAPGDYDLVAISRDRLLAAAIDGLRVAAGDAADDLALPLARSLELAGRVVDQDGVEVSGGTVALRRFGGQESMIESTAAGARFRFRGLAPGRYRLTPSSLDGDEGEAVEVRAPLAAVELRVVRLQTAILLMAPDAQGNCPSARLRLRSQDGQRGLVAYARDCVAELPNARAGSVWRVRGGAGERRYDQSVTLGFGTPLPPVCLDGACPVATAMIEVRVTDAAGAAVEAEVELLAGRIEPGRLVSEGLGRMAPGTTLTLRAEHADLQVTETFGLQAGMNHLLLRLPGRVARPAGDPPS